VRLDTDQDAARFGHRRGFAQHVSHQQVVLVGGGPGRFRPLVRVHNRSTALGREADRLLEVLRADLRLAQRRVRREAGEFDASLLARASHAEWVVEHRDAMKVAGFAEQLPPPVEHGFDVLVPQLRRLRDGPLERLVGVSHELQVDAQEHVPHRRPPSMKVTRYREARVKAIGLGSDVVAPPG